MKTFLTQPLSPDIKDYNIFLKKIFKKKFFSNDGYYHQLLEKNLKKYLKVNHVSLTSSGTDALILILRSFNFPKDSEVITSPFTWVTTANAIKLLNLKPVFVDIDKYTFNIDTQKIKKHINKKTVAILATHTFGNICEIEEINKVAKKNGLKIIYDASHCFGVKAKKNKIKFFNSGDVSFSSFHATKIFHTCEGGIVISKNKKIIDSIKLLKNNGLKNNYPIALGINSKMSEINAAFGLSILNKVNKEISIRKIKNQIYKSNLGNSVQYQIRNNKYFNNFSYFIIVLKSEKILKKIVLLLKKKKIDCRRYFYPSLNKLKFYGKTYKQLSFSEKISKTILSLPIYSSLSERKINEICNIILKINR